MRRGGTPRHGPASKPKEVVPEVGVSLRDLWEYKFTLTTVSLQLAAIRWWPRLEGARVHRPFRPSGDLAWFVPAFIWGIESLHHVAWRMFATSYCFASPLPTTVQAAALSGALMVLVIALCLLSEHLARAEGWAGRAPQLTLPLPVIAAITGVQWTWGAVLVGFLWIP